MAGLADLDVAQVDHLDLLHVLFWSVCRFISERGRLSTSRWHERGQSSEQMPVMWWLSQVVSKSPDHQLDLSQRSLPVL
jgi:hypothetical protein